MKLTTHSAFFDNLLGELFIIAVFIITTAFIAWLMELSSRQRWNEETGTHKRQTITNEIADEKRTNAGITKEQSSTAQPRNDDTEYKETYTRANLYLATQIIIAAVAAVGIPVAICSLLSLNKSVKAANQQAEAAATQARTAQQEFELSERPWVSIEPIQFSDLTFKPDGAHLSVLFSVKNTGHSPAGHAQIGWKLLPVKFDDIFKAVPKAQKQLCEALRSGKGYNFDLFTLFPDQSTKRASGTSSPMADLKAAQTKPFNAPEPFFALYVVGCIDYQFNFQPGHHQTGFIYDLRRRDPKYPGAPFEFHLGQDVPADNLWVIPYAFADAFYAD